MLLDSWVLPGKKRVCYRSFSFHNKNQLLSWLTLCVYIHIYIYTHTYSVSKDYKCIVLYNSHNFKEYIPTVFCRTILLAFSVPGEPVVVALLCLIGAWPGWSRLHPLENDLSTETFWNSCPTPRKVHFQSHYT
jgi:hypothetical protein